MSTTAYAQPALSLGEDFIVNPQDANVTGAPYDIVFAGGATLPPEIGIFSPTQFQLLVPALHVRVTVQYQLELIGGGARQNPGLVILKNAVQGISPNRNNYIRNASGDQEAGAVMSGIDRAPVVGDLYTLNTQRLAGAGNVDISGLIQFEVQI